MDQQTLLVALGAAALVMILPRIFGPKKAKPEAILAAIREGARVIDVRTPGEFASGAYPKARNVPLDALGARAAELGPKDKPLVVYCASGARSAQAAAFLRKSGFARVLDGGGLGGMPRA